MQVLANSNSDRVSVPLEKAADEKAAGTFETSGGEPRGKGGNADRVSVPLENAADTVEKKNGEPRRKGGGRPFRDVGKYIEAGIYMYVCI